MVCQLSTGKIVRRKQAHQSLENAPGRVSLSGDALLAPQRRSSIEHLLN